MRAKPREIGFAGKLRAVLRGRSHPAWINVTRLRAHGALLPVLMAACGAPAPPEGHASATMEEAVVRAGDVSIRATVVPTASLNPAVAGRYGIEPDRGSVLLLVGVREGTGMQETALPARITATATDLRGTRTAIEIRAIRPGELADSDGTVRTPPPETLRFELEVEHAAGAPSQLSFSRDLYPH